jgi:hypothetical protein
MGGLPAKKWCTSNHMPPMLAADSPTKFSPHWDACNGASQPSGCRMLRKARCDSATVARYRLHSTPNSNSKDAIEWSCQTRTRSQCKRVPTLNGRLMQGIDTRDGVSTSVIQRPRKVKRRRRSVTVSGTPVDVRHAIRLSIFTRTKRRPCCSKSPAAASPSRTSRAASASTPMC